MSLVWGAVAAGTAGNAIPQSGSVKGTIRMLDRDVWDGAEKLIRELVETAVAGTGAAVEIRPRVPFRLDVRILSDRTTDAHVHLEGDHGATVDDPDRTIALPAGATTVSYQVRVAEPGTTILRAQVRAEIQQHYD